MRKLSAHYIFPANSQPLKYGVLILDEEGSVVELVDTGGTLIEESQLEFYSGILTPGFVNSHCHLELSHLLNRIPEKTGISSFLEKITDTRTSEAEFIDREIRKMAEEMYQSGTSVVGDIVNTADTLAFKKESPIYWHSFVELFGLQSGEAGRIWQNGKDLRMKFEANRLPASISPHAPYSVSKDLWQYFLDEPPHFISIHNQESSEEGELMSRREGKMADWFRRRHIDIENLPEVQNSALKSIIEYIPEVERVLLVHNTYTSRDDIDLMFTRFHKNQVFWVLCPNSNLYIEDQLPENLIINRKGLQLCLGTDSLASNSSLSLIEEMKTVQARFPMIALDEIIRWATINGSRALGVEKIYGSFEKGKKPGVIWIDSVSHPAMALSPQSQAVRLL